MTVHIVITDFNGWAQTRECLVRLQASQFEDYKVWVVDHGLNDETKAGLQEFSWVHRIQADPELWWTGATNRGIEQALQAGARYVMLLNNDCFVRDTTLSKLMRHVDDANAGIVAPVQLSASTGDVMSGRVTTCFALGFPTLVLPSYRDVELGSEQLLDTELIVGGRGVVIPRSVFDAVGLLDEKSLPHYGADHDFYLRCKRHGLSLQVACDAIVDIDETRTSASRHPGQMTFAEFRHSFSDIRSHRNMQMLKVLFKRYFPVKALYPVGIALNVLRYTMIYLCGRVLQLVKRN